MKDLTYMAVDQYGETLHDLGPFPRKELLKRMGRKHASRMFVDLKSGGTVHIGWIIAGHWWTVYKVSRMERPA